MTAPAFRSKRSAWVSSRLGGLGKLLQAWRESQGIAEFDEALNADLERFCAARGLKLGASENMSAYFDAIEERIEVFARSRSLDPEASSTVEAFEAACEDFDAWCQAQSVQPYAPGCFLAWLSQA